MVRVITIEATANDERMYVYMHYPCENYEKEKSDAIEATKIWQNDNRFTDFKVVLRDCDMDMGKILKINNEISEESI